MVEFISFYGLALIEMAVFVLAICVVVALVEKVLGVDPRPKTLVIVKPLDDQDRPATSTPAH